MMSKNPSEELGVMTTVSQVERGPVPVSAVDAGSVTIPCQ
jgi:hypothetical protein